MDPVVKNLPARIPVAMMLKKLPANARDRVQSPVEKICLQAVSP